MKSLNLLAVLTFIAVAPLIATEEDPSILRAVAIKNAPYKAYPDFQGAFSPSRYIPGKFGMIDDSKFDPQVYQLENPVGIFWNERNIEAFQALLATGVRMDFNPLSYGALVQKEKLAKTFIQISIKPDNTIYSINLLEALQSNPIGTDGILFLDWMQLLQ